MNIDTTKIPECRARAIGRAFFYAYMNFVQDPENAKMIERRAREIREEKEDGQKEKADCVSK